MKTRCNARHTHSFWRCNLAVGHEGSHMDRSESGEVYATWGNLCAEGYATFFCTLPKGHTGEHKAYGDNGKLWHTWPQESKPKPALIRLAHKPEEHSVLLTLEELKGLVYALSGPVWLEEEPELVAKIDNALKEAL